MELFGWLVFDTVFPVMAQDGLKGIQVVKIMK